MSSSLGAQGRASTLGSLALTALLLWPLARAQAHAPAELTQLVSTKSDDVIIATNRGLIFGNLQTRAWSLLCGDGFDIGPAIPYRAALLPSGRLLLASDLRGMRFSDDRACTVQSVAALREISTPFMLQDPTRKERVYVATYGTGESAVRLSSDNGESYQKLLSAGDDDFIGTLLLAPGSGGTNDHLYAGITYFPAAAPNFSYFVSHSADGGKTWDRNEVVLNDNERDIALLAVNPARPEQLVLRATAEEPTMGERVLFSNDGGKTFSSPLTVRVLRTAAFSDDGKLLYIGGVDGLMRADLSVQPLTFAPAGVNARISQLEQHGDQLLAGGYYQGLDLAADGVGTGSIESPNFTRWLDFDEVQSHVDCPLPSPVNAECAMLFRDWQIENPPRAGGGGQDAGTGDAGVLPVLDAGRTDAGAQGTPQDAASDADASGGDNKSSSGGCALHESGSSGAAGSLLLVALALALRELLSARKRPARALENVDHECLAHRKSARRAARTARAQDRAYLDRVARPGARRAARALRLRARRQPPAPRDPAAARTP